MGRYHGGDQSLLLTAGDTPMPDDKAAADAWIAAVPGSPTIVGYAAIPDVSVNDNVTKGFATGSLISQFDEYGNRVGDVGADLRVGNVEILKKCLLGSGGLQDLADLAIFTGVDDSRGDGYTLVHRGCKCDTLGLSLAEPSGGQASPIKASAKFAALVPDTPGPALSPTLAQHRATGATLFWHNVMQATIKGDDLRDEIMSMSFTAAHELERKGHWPDYGLNDPLSRCHRYLRVARNMISGEFTFHPRLAAKYLNNAKDADSWGDVAIGCSNAAAIAGGTAKAFSILLTNVRYSKRQQKPGEMQTQMSHSISIVADDLRIITA